MDSGASWAGVNAGLADLRVLSLALAPTDSRTLYAGLDGASVWQATTALWVFADGLESGEACAWSAAVGGGCPQNRSLPLLPNLLPGLPGRDLKLVGTPGFEPGTP